MSCGPKDTTPNAQAQQRPTIRFRRDGAPLVTTATGNVTTLHTLTLVPRRDPLTKLERARDDLRDALAGIHGPAAADLLNDLDQAIADLKRERGP